MYHIKRLNPRHVEMVINLGVQLYDFQCTEEDDFWKKKELIEWFKSEQDICLGFFHKLKLVGYCLSHINLRINKVSIENIYVKKRYQKQGLGQKLLQTIIDSYIAKYKTKSHLLRFVALTQETNIQSISLFKKCNFLVGKNMIWLQHDFR